MSLAEFERQVPETSLRHERGDIIDISFAEAAAVSYGQYDTVEEKAHRVEVAQKLEVAMQPGAPVLHQVNRLSVYGGILTAPPKIVTRPYGREFALAVAFDIRSDNKNRYQEMYVRDFVTTTQYGAPTHLSQIVAGDENVLEFVRTRHDAQRAAEKGDGIAWNDISPLTELKTYAALAGTGLRLSDLMPQQAAELRGRLLRDLNNPAHAHLAPTLHGALQGVGTEETFVGESIRHVKRYARRAMGRFALLSLLPG
jgi:hypothetical protein